LTVRSLNVTVIIVSGGIQMRILSKMTSDLVRDKKVRNELWDLLEKDTKDKDSKKEAEYKIIDDKKRIILRRVPA